MVEIIDNSVQFAATLVCCAISAAMYLRRRSAGPFLLMCFYGCFSLGLLYWTLYLALYESTPTIFYVSEIAWISSYIFLYLLQYTLADAAERSRRCRVMWLAPLSGAVMFAFFCVTDDDIPSALLCCAAMSALAWSAIRGLVFGKRRRFHIAVLGFVCAEYALWVSSLNWLGDTLANPYFRIDFLLTGVLVYLLPAVRGEAQA